MTWRRLIGPTFCRIVLATLILTSAHLAYAQEFRASTTGIIDPGRVVNVSLKSGTNLYHATKTFFMFNFEGYKEATPNPARFTVPDAAQLSGAFNENNPTNPLFGTIAKSVMPQANFPRYGQPGIQLLF